MPHDKSIFWMEIIIMTVLLTVENSYDSNKIRVK